MASTNTEYDALEEAIEKYHTCEFCDLQWSSVRQSCCNKCRRNFLRWLQTFLPKGLQAFLRLKVIITRDAIVV